MTIRDGPAPEAAPEHPVDSARRRSRPSTASRRSRQRRTDAAVPPTPVARVAGPGARLSARDALKVIGPGIITGGADNDPAGITTYSVVGAQSGFSQNWLLILSTPLLIVVQQMAARLGSVTKGDFATAIHQRYGGRTAAVVVLAVVVANVLTLGADLEMMAAVTALITHTQLTVWVVPYAAFLAGVIIVGNYKTFSRFLLWLVAIFSTYIVAAFLARPDWGTVLRQTLLPPIRLDPAYFLGAVGLLGTTITPYLFFWQTSGEIEEKRGVQSLRRTRLDIIAGMIWSNLTAFFILVVTGTVLYAHHKTVQTAADAARALAPFAGPYAEILFAIGIVGAGLLAIPVLAASTAYSVAGLLGWRRSLARQVTNAPQFYVVLGCALLVAVQFAVMGVNPIQALFYSQVLDGVIAPILVVLLLLLTCSRAVMGTFANRRPTVVIGWVAVGVLVAADLALFYSLITAGLPH